MTRSCYGRTMSNKDTTRFAKRISVRIPLDLLEEIERIQARHNLDLTRVIVSMLRHGLDVYNREVADRAVGPRRRVRAWG